MDLQKVIGALIGTSFLSFSVRILIALASLYTGSATNIGDAIGQALDKERSIAAAVELIQETPPAEIEAAVEDEVTP